MNYGYPTRVISGQDIIELKNDQQVVIGHTIEYCNDLESTLNEAIEKAEKYYDRLVELGEITKPKSQEDIYKEQQEINNKFVNAINKLTEMINNLEKSDNDGLNKISDIDSSSDKPEVGKPSRKGTK